MNAKTEHGETPIMMALERELGETAKLLIEHRPLPRTNEEPSVSSEYAHNHISISKVLYDLVSTNNAKALNFFIDHVIPLLDQHMVYQEINMRTTERSETALHRAVRERPLYRLAKVLMQVPYVNVNVRDSKGYTPLHRFLNSLDDEDLNDFGIFDAFMGHRAVDLNTQNLLKHSLVHTASKKGGKLSKHYANVIAIDKRFNVNLRDLSGSTAIHEALRFNRFELAESLLARENAEVNFQDSQLQTLLHLAIERKKVKITRALLKREDIDVDTQDSTQSTPLHIASKEGHLGIVNMLLKKETIGLNKSDYLGCTAVMLAVQYGHVDIVEALLEMKDIDINCQDKYGKTALHKAISADSNAVEVAEMLLAIDGIDVALVDENQQSALSLAVQSGMWEIAKRILSRVEVDANIPYEHERTPLQEAAIRGDVLTVMDLLHHDHIQIN